MINKFYKKHLSNPVVRFLLFFSVMIFLWFTCYHFIYRIDILFSNATNEVNLLNSISILLGNQSNLILNFFGYDSVLEVHGDIVITKIIGNDFDHGVWIGEPCNGLKIFGVFSIFILSYPGSNKSKIWFIPLGIILLHFINVFRIAILTIISSKNPYLLDFNHNITFQVIVYSFILLFWHIWINKISNIKVNSISKG